MCLSFSWSGESETAPAGHPASRPGEIGERSAGASPFKSREPVGSAGKEAVLAPCGVVENAASARYQDRPTLRRSRMLRFD
jgi:hypothetical protein